MKIRLLPERIFRLICPGDLFKRPAAAVKELIENGIDAGARTIRVEVLGGGSERILIVDDGSGMGRDDLRLSVERHATSKLDGDDPLMVRTMGFRGEALATLSAMERLRLTSRTAEDDCAWSLRSDPDGVTDPVPCGGTRGTTIEVSDLFFSHPARAKFIKGRRSENSAIRAVVEATAMAYPAIGFHLHAEGRSVLMLNAADWETRAAAVMGPEFTANSLSFSAAGPGMQLRGRVGLPGWRGHATAGQWLMVNGRPVRDQVLSSAMKAAFATLSKETTPAVALDLQLDVGLLDANVHPSKQQIRLSQPDAVHALVRDAVRGALEGGAPRQHAQLEQIAAAAAVPVELGAEVDRRKLPLGRALGVALGGFGLAETNEGIILLDLHALHERRMFTLLSNAVRSGGIEPRASPRPLVLSLGDAATAAIEKRLESLGILGLVLGTMEGGAVAVYGVPSPLPDAAATDLVREVADILVQDAHGDPVGGMLDRLCARMACHSAFRFGDACSLDDLDRLLRECESGPHSGLCPHGRPTAVEISRSRVESMFGRH